MCLQGRKDWLEVIELLNRRFGGEWNVILKVHPGEKPDEYRQFIAQRGLNTPVILDGYMVEMLPHMDLLLHCASTTALEAHYLGIPAFNYKDPDPHGPAYFPAVSAVQGLCRTGRSHGKRGPGPQQC